MMNIFPPLKFYNFKTMTKFINKEKKIYIIFIFLAYLFLWYCKSVLAYYFMLIIFLTLNIYHHQVLKILF